MSGFEAGAWQFASLECEFELACEVAVDECKALTPPYIPTTWISMIAKYGAAEAARRLVISGEIQTGFDRLVKLKRHDLTVEWIILDEKWNPLFSEQHRLAAQWRLRQVGVELPS